MYSSFALLALATVALAKTDIGGCTKTIIGNSVTYYVPGTGEICEILDCGGGRAPAKTTVPGCAAYEGTSTYSPKYLSLAAATTTSAIASSTPAEKSTLTSASTQATSTTASSSASAPVVTSSAVASTISSTSVVESSSVLTSSVGVSSSSAVASGVASSSRLSTVTTSSTTAASNGTSSTSSTPSPIQAVPNSVGSLNAMGGLMVVAAGFAILL